MPRLRRVNLMCSRTVSGTAYRFRHGSTLCSPTVEKILCRSPISQRSHVGNLRQTLQGKGEIHKRVETAGVYPLVRPRGVSALPAEVQRKTPRPERANPPAAVRVPRSAGAEKDSRPSGANRLRGSCTPAIRCRNGLCPPLEHKKRNPYGFLFEIALPYQDALRTPGIWPL